MEGRARASYANVDVRVAVKFLTREGDAAHFSATSRAQPNP